MTVFFAACECFQMILCQSYIIVTFLMMYATMWSLDMPFDTRFYVVAASMLVFIQSSVVNFFGMGVRDLALYLPAAKRIEV